MGNRGSGITGAMCCCDCVPQTHSLHRTDTHVTLDLLTPLPPPSEQPRGLATGSKVRGVRPIEFQRKISSLGLGGNGKMLLLRSWGEKKEKTLKNLGGGERDAAIL